MTAEVTVNFTFCSLSVWWFGLERLIFFAVADMGLYFGFVTNTGLIIQRFFFTSEQCSHTAKTFSAFCAARLVRKLEVHGRCITDTARRRDQRYILYYVTSCLVYKNGKRKKETEQWDLSSQVTIMHDRTLPLHRIFSQQPALEMAEHLPVKWIR